MITAVVLARNEALLLRSLIPSLSFADSVVVMDDGSTDDTAQVCAQFGAIHIRRSLSGDFSAQRNAALANIKKGWVLFVDADETVSDELAEAMVGVSNSKSTYDGFYVRRIDRFLGKTLLYGETGSTWLLRFAKVGAGVFTGKVHETWQVKGSCGKLKGHLIHDSHESVGQLFSVVNRYARLRSKELIALDKPVSLIQALIYPAAKFGYTFFLKRGFLDGFRGLVMSLAMSWHSWLVRWYVWDRPWERKRSPNHWIKYLMVLPLVLLPFGQLGRFWVSDSVSVYGFEMVMLAVVMATVLFDRQMVFMFKRPRWFWPLVGFSVWLMVSWLWWWGDAGWGSAGLYVVRWWLYAIFGYLFWGWSQKGLVSIAGLLDFVGFGWLMGGIMQYILFPDLRFLKWYGWDDHYFRMAGTIFDPNYFGLLMVLVGVWIVYKHRGLARNIGGGMVIAALLATYSRASYVVGAVVGLSLFVLTESRYKWMVLSGVMGMMVMWWIVAPRVGGEGVNLLRVYSVESRIRSWEEAGRVWQESPVVGIGYNRYQVYMEARQVNESIPYHPSAPDNAWLYILATTGIVGMVSWLWLLIAWWQSVNVGGRLSLVAILAHSVFNNSFFLPFVLLWWWLLLAHQEQERKKQFILSS